MWLIYIFIGVCIGIIVNYIVSGIKTVDKVHPTHYVGEGNKQCIDYMIEQFGAEHTYWFCRINAFKYRFRAGRKPGETAKVDYEKADWYDNYAVKLAEKLKINNIKL